ncbi:MAG: DUF3105 domain-containing protein [Thermoflexus sp.]
MARKKARRKPAPRVIPRRLWLLAGSGIALLVLGGLAWWIYQQGQAYAAFQEAVRRGQPALSRVETFPEEGRAHLQPGERANYRTDPPTSGPHSSEWVNPGFYTREQPPEHLVHSLEHGHVVIYYDDPGPEALQTLQAWARMFNGQWDGVVVVPKRRLGRAVILTAWTHMLRLESFDVNAAAAFIDAFRGRGPENPVR